MEILKLAVLLANEHQSDPKKCNKRFSYKCSLCISLRKNDSVNGIPENVASRSILTKMVASVFIEYIAISDFFAVISYQYMEIYHTKKQTKNIPRSCSYLLLKTLFYFILQCTLESYLESGLCKLDKELANCNFTFTYPRNRPLNKSDYEVCEYKTLGCTELFSLHIERPSYVF